MRASSRVRRRAALWALAAGVAVLVTGAGAQAVAAAPLAALRLGAEPPPIAARYEVTVLTAAAGTRRASERRQDWTFHRDAASIALLKGAIDEVWHRDARGQVSFERVFHARRQAVDYSAGELATLGVQADWAGLATLVDAGELAALKLVSRSGRGSAETLHLAGRSQAGPLAVDWLPALQLPALLLRTGRDRSVTRIKLLQHAAVAPAAWPRPGQRSADYLRFDAADFGDMDYEPVVRHSEALDVRAGWRAAHAHD